MSGEGLGLDPENDPVVYSTESGLDIKFHQEFPNFDTSSSTGVSGYAYFTMGIYNNQDINWVIIGKNPNLTKSSSLYIQTYTSWMSFGYCKLYSGIDDSPAGNTIKSECLQDLIYDYLDCVFANAVSNSEVPSNCVLCISEKSIFNAAFDYTYEKGTANYGASNLKTVISNLSATLNLTDAQLNLIQPQTINTYYTQYYTGTKLKSTLSNQLFFPLATYSTFTKSSYPQEFYVETYLSTNTLRNTGQIWWLRTGYQGISEYVQCVNASGGITYTNMYDGKGIRPAFVLKL